MDDCGVVVFKKNDELKSIFIGEKAQPNNFGNKVLHLLQTKTQEELEAFFFSMEISDKDKSSVFDLEGFINSKEIFKYKDAYDVLLDSFVCSYAYIINLDSYEFEIYKSSTKDSVGMFRGICTDGIYPVSLIRAYSFFELPKNLPIEGLEIEYEDLEIDIDDEILESLMKEADKKKISLDALVEMIIKESVEEKEKNLTEEIREN